MTMHSSQNKKIPSNRHMKRQVLQTQYVNKEYLDTVLAPVFTALHCMQGGLSYERLSICPSVKRVNCDKTKAPSEKSSIMTNRKSPTSFPMSLR